MFGGDYPSPSPFFSLCSGPIWGRNVVSRGHGLSVFLLSNVFFAGSASTPLLLLSLGSSFKFPMIFGFFFVHPVPPLEEELNYEVYSETCSSAYEQRNSLRSHTPLLNHNSHPVCVIYRLAPKSKGSLATTNNIRFIFLAQKNHRQGLDIVLAKQ